MKKLFIAKFDGLNWYATNKSTTVNATNEDVTLENYNEVQDIDCFSVCQPFTTQEELYIGVCEHVANGKTWDVIFSKISLLFDNEIANTICQKLEKQSSIRENEVLANFDSIEIEGNCMNIYAKDGSGIVVGLENRLGDIIG